MGLEKLIIRRTYCYLFAFLLIFLAGCKDSVKMPAEYLIIRCHSFWVIEHTDVNSEGRVIYEISKDEGLIITSIAYYPQEKLLAVALTSKEPQKRTGIIRLFNYSDFTLESMLITEKDRISGMNFSAKGDLVFSANSMNRNFPGELCYIPHGGEMPTVLAKGIYANHPVWDNDSKGVYFTYRRDEKDRVGYLNINEPEVIQEIGLGTSVSVSNKGVIAYLANGKIFTSDKMGQEFKPINLAAKYTDPRFADRIAFVKGADDIVLQSYKKSTVYDLVLTRSPYTEANVILPDAGMLDFEVINKQ